ncbi:MULTISPECIES: ABC transporter ATP-binding protein [unclassified Haladaptatus]|uniref:ABC transporter ATP-binding protein n=1 Tax=unclassified Haladaptatus TaxID=2622732 RepID=UPI00209C3049|nr:MULTISPECIES: ABC transporter ATP-binding protein [unclassified Haladaptatus]MCO8243690.1 ABC transporter ATP-binding protein [Haladaptatus sp. AB643]MCO8255099.1 ABC transporter ATP-binding protein [Haladaptatus sp. AB618]
MGKLDIRNLRKEFLDGDRSIVAVEDLNIDIDDGEFLIFVGPSGCGKSTTLRCIAGLESPTGGNILLNETDITNKPPTERDIAMVFQNYALYPHLTARKNIGFGLKMSTDMGADEIERRVDDVAEMMGIEEILEKKPGELSGGQQQRVALGRAIVREPEVFLMDEPLSNLDAKLRTTMRTELQNLQQDLNITTIYVTHDQTEAMTMGDRIAILNDGKLQQLGTPLECYYEPANRFVAGFIGSPSMNFFEVDYVDGALVHDTFRYDLSPKAREQLVGYEGRMTLGIRPESIETVPADEPGAISTTVSVTEPMGELTYAYVDIGDQTCTVTLSGERMVESGTTLTIDFPEDKIHLFDPDTGETVKTRSVSTATDTNVDARA